MVFCRPSLLVLWLGTVTGCSSEQLFLNRVMHPWTRGKLQFLQLQHGRGSIVRTTLHSIWSSAAVNVMRCTRDPSRLSRASPHTRVPQGPVPQHPKSPPGQHPSHFQMTPGRRALFHRQRTGIHHPTSKDRPKKLPAPGSRLASSFHSCFRAVRCSTACTVVFAYTLQRDIDGRPLAVANSLSCPIEDSVLLP